MSDTAAIRWQPIAVASAAALVTAFCGGALTQIGPWYQGLRKPSWQPPNWLFPPAWTTIFALEGASGVLAWNAGDAATHPRVIALFAVNAALNVTWSALFFALRRPDLALIEVAALWLSITALVAGLTPLSLLAGLLTVPYLLWVSFAAVLNLTIVRLNPSFAKATS